MLRSDTVGDGEVGGQGQASRLREAGAWAAIHAALLYIPQLPVF
jgi:hypothetical protein